MAYGKPKITGTMPFRYCADDAQWIDEQLSLLGISNRAEIAAAYGRAFQCAEDAEDVDHKKLGAARFVANTRLRKYINKKVCK